MSTYAVVPQSGESHLHLMNSLPCPVELKLHNASGIYSNIVDIEARANSIIYELSPGQYDIEATVPTNCPGMTTYSKKLSLEAKDKVVAGLLIRSVRQGELALTTMGHEEEPEKEDDGSPKLRVIFDTGVSAAQNLTVRAQGDGDRLFGLQGLAVEGSDLVESGYIKAAPGSFDVYAETSKVGELHLIQGGVHILVVRGQANLGFEQEMIQYTLTQPNTIHMLWLLPQYFIITTGEILFSVSGLEFSYSQAPESMKSVLQAFWLLTVSFGNLIVLIIAEAKAFNEQASEFFMFGVLMVVDMLIFAIMAYRYQPIDWAKRKRDEAQPESNGVHNESYREETDF